MLRPSFAFFNFYLSVGFSLGVSSFFIFFGVLVLSLILVFIPLILPYFFLSFLHNLSFERSNLNTVN